MSECKPKEVLICSKCKEQFYRVGFKFCPFDGTPMKWKKVTTKECD